MTENETVEILKNNYPKTCKMVNGRYQGGFDNTECDFGQALTMAIEALEEIQQYREIGTVEECREAREKQTPNKPKDGLYGHGYFACGSCKNPLDGDESYCPQCGQAIRWEN